MIGYYIASLRKEQNLSRRKLAELANVSTETIKWWEESGVSPDKSTLPLVASALNSTVDKLLIKTGQVPDQFQRLFREYPDKVMAVFEKLFEDHPGNIINNLNEEDIDERTPTFTSELGSLFQADCMSVFPDIEASSVDCIFADPPFNLGKDYGKKVDDQLDDNLYLEWSYSWIDQAIRVLKPGGSFFLYNIPKWNIHLASYLSKYLEFKHWVAIDIKFSLPISGRLYPSHYSLLYFVKGKKSNHFTPPRLPLPTCRHCGGEIKDYGGHKKSMNPGGVNLTDVWLDIPPVRHRRYKNRSANELSIKMIDRALDIATEEGDLVLDPFGGAGTTFVACELTNRKWIGFEIGNVEPIIQRLSDLSQEREQLNKIHRNINTLFTRDVLLLREDNGHDTSKYNFDSESCLKKGSSNGKAMNKKPSSNNNELPLLRGLDIEL